jgi:hypothetical protein
MSGRAPEVQHARSDLGYDPRMRRHPRSPRFAWLVTVLALLALLLPGAGALGAEVRDTERRFRLGIPDGFVPVSGAAKGDVLHVYRREGMTGAQLGTVVTVERLRGVIGREPLKLEQVQRDWPGATLSDLAWKSFTVQVMEREIDLQGRAAVALVTQIPLRPEAIQLTVITDRGAADSARSVLRALLADLDGESTWLTDRERSRSLGEGIGRLLGIGLGIVVVVWLVRKARG